MMPRRRLPGRLTAPTRPRGLVLLLAALAVLLLCGGAPRFAAAVTPSPADWRDITIYQLLTDRFYDGVPANDNAEGAYQPATGNRTHGGDFAGLAQKLDYLQGLGVGAVWISPVYLNAFGEYHGYAARDFYAVSSQFGGLTALQSFVNAAHARGIYVVIDIVLNHMGDMIDSGSSGYPGYRANPSPYVLRYKYTAPRPAAPFNNLAWFHNNGAIDNYVDPNQILGELASLDDIKTELPAVRDALVAASSWLIDQTDCDGFRIDTVKHVEMGFWQDWTPRVQAHCQAVGKANFLMFGEVFDGSDAKCGSYTGTMAGGAYALNSMLYYPMYYAANDVFIYNQPTSRLTERLNGLSNYDPTVRETLVKFLDNHDNERFLSAGKAAQDTTKLRVALDWILTSREIPCLYYGTEQMFDGGGDPWCREDMWDGQWDYGPSDGDNFNMTQPLYLRVARLNELRHRYPALARGTQTLLQDDAGGPGLYVYSRQYAGQEVVVALNTAAVARTTNALATTFGAGVPLVDLADPATPLATNGAGQVTLTVPARGSRLVTKRADLVTLSPRVIAVSPRHDARTVPGRTPLALTFSVPMDTLAVMQAFTLLPAGFGRTGWSADRRTFTFTPLTPWTAGTLYTVRVDDTARDAGGRALVSGFESLFRAGAGGTTSVTVPDGYRAEVFAETGLTTPEGLAFGPGTNGWSGDLYVGDEVQKKILRIDATGTVSTFVSSATYCQKPEGLAFDRAGGYTGALLAADYNQYVRVTAAGAASALGGAAAAARTGTLAQAPAGPWGGLHYTSSVDANQVYALSAAGALTPVISNIRGPEGLAFGPGGAWGTDLYVADASLVALAGTIDGDAAIYRYAPGGARTTVAQDAALLAGAGALAFDTVGQFGGDLFVSDVLHERILRVTPAGAVSVFASGFGNLFASGGLVFGADGALYVADTGAGQPFGDASGGSAVGRVLRIVRVDTTDVPVDPNPALLLRGAPNPFTLTTELTFTLPVSAAVRLDVFSVAGRPVARLLERPLAAGPQRITWDGRDSSGRKLPSGIYFARLQAGAFVTLARLVVQR